MARTREVFPTEEIAHKWAHQSIPCGRNPQGNFRFTGAVITSYSADIAQIYKHSKRGVLVLIDEHRYSVTTGRQLSLIAGAVRHMPHMYVPKPCPRSYELKEAHAKNIAYLLAKHDEALAAAQCAQSAATVDWRWGIGESALEDAGKYCVFFGIRRKIPAFPADAWNAARARALAIENPSAEELARREKARAKRSAAEEATLEYRTAMVRSMEEAGHHIPWRARQGKRWPEFIARAAKAPIDKQAEFLRVGCLRSAWRLGIQCDARDGAIMLRVDGDDILTSHGARIPLSAAPAVWAIVERCRTAGGRDFSSALQRGGYRVGDYALDSVGADGTLVAGCHSIPHSELRAMARRLGLAAA